MRKKCIVVTNPMVTCDRSPEVSLNKFLRVLSPVYQEFIVLSGNIVVDADLLHIHLIDCPLRRGKTRWQRIIAIFLYQLRLACHVLKHAERGMPVCFWVADKMLLPYWAAKLKRADLRFFLYGNVTKEGSAGFLRSMSGRLITYLANHADSVCVESPGVLEEWGKDIVPRRVRLLHLYTEMGVPSPISQRQKVVGMLCRLSAGKHAQESIEAFVRFHQQHSDYRLEIIGSGEQEQACRALIARCGAESYIHMTGWIDHHRLGAYTAKWKYLLFPTDAEGMPNSVIEMMGQGIPAIASPVGGLRDLIRHGENGWLLKGTTPDEILHDLSTVIRDQENYAPVAQAARRTIASQFSLQHAQENALRSMTAP